MSPFHSNFTQRVYRLFQSLIYKRPCDRTVPELYYTQTSYTERFNHFISTKMDLKIELVKCVVKKQKRFENSLKIYILKRITVYLLLLPTVLFVNLDFKCHTKGRLSLNLAYEARAKYKQRLQWKD